MKYTHTFRNIDDFHRILKDKITYIYLFFFTLILAYTYLVSDPILNYYEVEGYDKKLNNYNTVDIILIILITPFLEELLFRGYLSGYKKHFVFILPQIVISVFIINDFWFWIFISSIIVSLFIIYDEKVNNSVKLSTTSLIISVLFTSLLFSLMHSSNFQLDSLGLNFFLSIVSFFPGSLFLALMRIKEGLILSAITHSILNFSILALNQFIY
jgi:membrane protease YdiL (CAAX protease family)